MTVSLRRVFGAACVALAALSFSGAEAYAQGRASGVMVDEVTTGPLAQTIPVLGRLVPRQQGVVAALTRGPVEEVTVDVGDRVERGQVILSIAKDRIIQSRELQAARLTEAQARVRTARADLEIARSELQRLERLRQSAAFSQARFEDAANEVSSRQSEVNEAVAAVASAEADLAIAEIDLRLSDVQAPFDGVVVHRQAEVGSYLNIGDPVVTLINDQDLEIEADVPASRIQGLRQGRTVEAAFSDTERFEAFVRAVIPEENALTRTRVVRFTPALAEMRAQAESALAANQTVTVFVPVGAARTVTSVHKDAVTAQGSGFVAFVVEDGKAMMRPVRIGEAIGGRFEVLDGLQAGELVVIRGNERLRPGEAVTYPGMPAAKPAEGGQQAPAAGTKGS